MRLFRIKNTKSGEFYTQGRFTSAGKFYVRKGDLTQALRNLGRFGTGVEIVEYEAVEIHKQKECANA